MKTTDTTGPLAPLYREIKNPVTLRIAAAFRRGLLADIGASPLREADERNNAETDPRVCHTHDYCDANEYMADAFAEVMGRPIDLQSSADGAVWMDAWQAFKAEGRRLYP